MDLSSLASPSPTATPPGSVLVTRGSSGLGAAVVEAVTKAGGRPAVIDIPPPVDAEIPHVLADVGDTVAATAAVYRLAEDLGGVDAVVTAAGIDACGPLGVVGFTRSLATELAGRVAVTLLVPGGMRTRFFDDRTEQYRPGPDAALNDPQDVAGAVMMALSQPWGCEIRELVVAASTEPSWP